MRINGVRVKRSRFPWVFWTANSIEVLERFAYYGIYMGFGIYMSQLGFSSEQLGTVQSLFLAISYLIPLFSGSLADKFGFKRMLIISYIAYLPPILLLIYTKTFSGIALTMISIAFAAGIFKPLVSGTVRVVTDKTNKTLGFGIFYQMVNLGGAFGPLIAGSLRAISWKYAFIMAAISIGVMFLITVFLYKEPKRKMHEIPLSHKLKEIGLVLADFKFSFFLILLGIFFWLPLWSFFNIAPRYVDSFIDTARLYLDMKSVLGETVANFISHIGDDGQRRILGETISHTGWVILFFQILISRIFERRSAIKTFLIGLAVAAFGFMLLAMARTITPSLVLLGIFVFATGEMISSIRIQEYITCLAPKEKAGMYMGTNFLAAFLGGFLSGFTYTVLFGRCIEMNHPELVWYVLAAHLLVGIMILSAYIGIFGHFKEITE
jgi:proton-dependent oligopeptide transporter, POT family